MSDNLSRLNATQLRQLALDAGLSTITRLEDPDQLRTALRRVAEKYPGRYPLLDGVLYG